MFHHVAKVVCVREFPYKQTAVHSNIYLMRYGRSLSGTWVEVANQVLVTWNPTRGITMGLSFEGALFHLVLVVHKRQ